MEPNFQHEPVLLRECIEALRVAEGNYGDMTAGGGGHSAAIAEQLKGNGRLLCVDRDPEAITALRKRFQNHSNVVIVQENFFAVKLILEKLQFPALEGILADLGVSSRQLDAAERGFSYHSSGPLDMRMSMSGHSAADAVNTLLEIELRDIFYRYGEEKYAPLIAKGIFRARAQGEISTTAQLAEIVKSSVPAAARRASGHPARKVFQALRIYVNAELDGLDRALDDLFGCLTPGGRLAVISFHSLEDRIVKLNFRKHCRGCDCPPEFPVCVCGKEPEARLPQKTIQPSAEELTRNPRSRSAKLRVLEKL